MDVEVRAKEQTYEYKELLRTISIIINYSPNHTESALQQLYQGVLQASGEKVGAYLEKFLEFGEDSLSPANSSPIEG